ncbi:MAG: DinB family protein [Bacteroidota bacterium]
MTTHKRPQPHEYAPFYAPYVAKAKHQDFQKSLIDLRSQTIKLVSDLTEAQWNYRYAPEKWSIKEVLLHLLDCERIFAYRALRIARNDSTTLPGFEQDDYVPFCNAEQRTPASIIVEYKAVRQATIHLFKNFSKKDFQRKGTASGFAVSVLGLGYIIVGHEMHHLAVLAERYFASAAMQNLSDTPQV